MPVFGMAIATYLVLAVERKETVRRHLGGKNEPAVPSPTTPLVSQPETDNLV